MTEYTGQWILLLLAAANLILAGVCLDRGTLAPVPLNIVAGVWLFVLWAKTP